mmetsp:Transcript_107381/g.181564  ORF Transcript_107381/g.181564 Transcript_107381/m.181564 type:complete len:209 (-) Transcript_107381:347-973(-)
MDITPGGHSGLRATCGAQLGWAPCLGVGTGLLNSGVMPSGVMHSGLSGTLGLRTRVGGGCWASGPGGVRFSACVPAARYTLGVGDSDDDGPWASGSRGVRFSTCRPAAASAKGRGAEASLRRDAACACSFAMVALRASATVVAADTTVRGPRGVGAFKPASAGVEGARGVCTPKATSVVSSFSARLSVLTPPSTQSLIKCPNLLPKWA